MAKWFPPHLLYKEWRQQRTWLILAALIALFGPVVRLINVLLQETNGNVSGLQFGLNSLSMDIHNNLGLISSEQAILPFLAVALGVAGLCLERSSSALTFTMSGPVKRRELLRTKFVVGWAAVLGIFILLFVLAMLEWVIFGLQGPSVRAIVWYIFQMSVSCAAFAIAFAAATAVGNILAAGLCALGVCGVPAALAVLMQAATNGQAPYQPWHKLIDLSPLSYAAARDSYPIQFVVFVWFLLVTLVAYHVAQYLFDKSEVENYSNFFIFSVLWKWVVGLACAAVGLVTCAIFRQEGGPGFLVFFLMATFVYWTITSRVLRRFNRNKTPA
jgi:ABC-type transport system involved in multi-copper enzyme maturation permease subunit